MTTNSQPSTSALAPALTNVLARAAAAAGTPMQPAGIAALQLAFAHVLAKSADGHTCVDLAELATATEGATESRATIEAAVDRLRADLLATGAVATAPRDLQSAIVPLPLVLDARNRVFLLRHVLAERRLAAFFRTAAEEERTPGEGAIRYLRSLSPKPGTIDWQAAAVAMALTRRVTVVTGGPGTGKTTTIQRILAALYHDQKDLQIALVAPTGKAALRMDAARTQLLVTCPDAEIARATTLHRLLGFRPGEDAFARGRGSSLPFDVVVVDEASMVDLELMDALLASLRDDARLLLLGDRNQLSAIGAGQVLRDLCSLARPELGAGRALAARCREWLGMELPVQDRPAPLLDCIVALRTTYRFDDSSGIGAFARAVAMHDDEAALSAMQNSSTDLVLVPHAALESVLRPWLPRFRDQCAASSPHDALLRQQRLRVLCAVNQGPFGKDAVNALVEARLGPRNLDSDGDYQGRPVLITSNDYQTGLMNGDLGVIWPDERGRLLAWFEAPDGFGPRSFLPLRLPPHETAWAMTVHKSQGSEFDHVLVVLPDQNSPLLDAPLLYTAITRAKKTATVIADTAVVQKAIATRETRGSGLCDWLAEADGA